jgi:hypothetical protein
MFRSVPTTTLTPRGRDAIRVALKQAPLVSTTPENRTVARREVPLIVATVLQQLEVSLSSRRIPRGPSRQPKSQARSRGRHFVIRVSWNPMDTRCLAVMAVAARRDTSYPHKSKVDSPPTVTPSDHRTPPLVDQLHTSHRIRRSVAFGSFDYGD